MTTPATSQRLPAELVAEVLLYATGIHETIDDSNRRRGEITALLVSCCRVSRFWGHVARSLLYKQVILTGARSAVFFIRTLNTAPACAALVTTLVIWTSIYERPGAVSRFPLGEKMSAMFLRSRRRCDDRFLDTVARRCRNLTRLSVQNRSKADTPVRLPSMANCTPTLLSQLRSLELDVYRKYEQNPGAKISIAEAFTSGRLELPELENLTLIRPSVYSTSSALTWRASVPLLRHLVILDGSLNAPICRSIMTASPPTLRELHLVTVLLQDYTLQLPPTLKVIAMHNCVVSPNKLSHLLALCAASLTDLELVAINYPTSDLNSSLLLPPWPHFERLARLRIGWERIETFGLSLLSHVLPALTTLEVTLAPESGFGAGNTWEMKSAAKSVLDVLTAHASALQSLTLRGNPYLDAQHLSLALHSIPRLRLLRIGTDILQLQSDVLLQLPFDLRHLQLCLEGLRGGVTVEDFLLERERRRSASPPSAFVLDRLETIDVFSTAPERPGDSGIQVVARYPHTPISPLRNPEVLLKLGVNLLTERIEPRCLARMTPIEWSGAFTPQGGRPTPWHTFVQAKWFPINAVILDAFNFIEIVERKSTRRNSVPWTILFFVSFVLQMLVGMLIGSILAGVNLVVIPAWFMVVMPCSILLERLSG